MSSASAVNSIVFFLNALSALAVEVKEGGSVGSHRAARRCSGCTACTPNKLSVGFWGSVLCRLLCDKHRVTIVWARKNSLRMKVIWNDLMTCATSYQTSNGSSMLQNKNRNKNQNANKNKIKNKQDKKRCR
jgi:hypothetical protein